MQGKLGDIGQYNNVPGEQKFLNLISHTGGKGETGDAGDHGPPGEYQ